MTTDVVEMEQRWREAATRRGRRRAVGAAVVTAAVAAVLVVRVAAADISPTRVVWLVCVATAFALAATYRPVNPVASVTHELEAVEVVEVNGRYVVVRTRHGQSLMWRIRAWRRPPRPGPAWATAPVRRLHASTLVTQDDSGTVRWYEAATVALYSGAEQPAVVVDEADPSGFAARTRTADPARLLATVIPQAARLRRQWAILVTFCVSSLVAAVVAGATSGDGDDMGFMANTLMFVILVAGLGWTRIGHVGALRHGVRLELVEVVEERGGDRVRIRTADGHHLTWSTPHLAEPLPQTGALWVTAPVEPGRRLTVVLPHGRDGARFVGAATKAVDSPPLPGTYPAVS